MTITTAHKQSARIATRAIRTALLLLVALFTMASCSESDGNEQEYADWQNRNETYFESIYSQAEAAIANGDTSWKIIRAYTKKSSTTTHTDFIVAHVTTTGEGTESPIYTQTVEVHYRGYLIPSKSYSGGLQFDSSWEGDYDLDTMVASSGTAGSFVDGFSTAVMNMHSGDRWMVYIPYQLGYKTTDNGSVPAYSTLIFDLTLATFK